MGQVASIAELTIISHSSNGFTSTYEGKKCSNPYQIVRNCSPEFHAH
jgi:hypothetical protein